MNFEEVGQQYVALKGQLERQLIAADEFEQSVKRLVAVAPDGRKWQIDPFTANWVELGDGRTPVMEGKAQAKAPQSLLELIPMLAKGLVKSLPRMIMIGLLVSVCTWVAHTYIIAKVNDGLMYNSAKVAVNSVVHLQTTHFPGVNAFWGLLSYFVAGFFMRALSVGPKNWFNNILQLPDNIRQSVNRGKVKGHVIMLAGVFAALLIMLLFRNYMLSWILAFGILLVMTAHFASLETLVLKVALQDFQRLSRRSIVQEGEEYDSVYLLLLGMCGGFFLVGIWQARLTFTIIGLLLVVGLFVYIQQQQKTKVAPFLVLIGTALLLPETSVFAWCEGASLSRAGGSWTAWWGSNNADLVRRLGIMPAGFSFVGGFLGSAAANLTPLISSLFPGADAVIAPGSRTYDFGDGREYQEGRTYTFDDGREYSVTDGELKPVRELQDGEVYINPDGDQKIWIGGQSWYESDWKRQEATNEAYIKAHREDWAREQERRRQEILEEQRKKQEEAVRKATEEKRLKEERYEAARRKRDDAETEAALWNRAARILDIATRTTEAIKYGCDKFIDVLAKVKGPKGKAIRKAYRAASAMAGGVGEGMATGNFADSMLDAAGETVGNLIEDSTQTDRYKTGFAVFRTGTAEAWQQGREAYRKGESVLGAAATGFGEGAASAASEEIKEGLKGGSKYAYTIAEEGFKGGYEAYKKGGDTWDVVRGAGGGLKGGAIDAVVDYGVSTVFDNLIPETGAVDDETMHSQMKDYQAHHWRILSQGLSERRLTWGDEMLNEWTGDFIYDQFRDEVKELATKSAQNKVKGRSFDYKLYEGVSVGT